MERQELLNALCAIEDEARKARNDTADLSDSDFTLKQAFDLITQLTQIIRQEIVR